MNKQQVIEKIQGHIDGCIKSQQEYIDNKDWSAASEMENRITGLKLALEYVKRIKTDK